MFHLQTLELVHWDYCQRVAVPLDASDPTPARKLIDAGVIRPVVDKIFPFAQTAEALVYVETGRAKGKVVVAISQ